MSKIDTIRPNSAHHMTKADHFAISAMERSIDRNFVTNVRTLLRRNVDLKYSGHKNMMQALSVRNRAKIVSMLLTQYTQEDMKEIPMPDELPSAAISLLRLHAVKRSLAETHKVTNR